MPNWVFNKITINGKAENIEQFLSDSKKDQNGQMSFASWIPVPETFQKYDTTNFPNGKGLEIGKPSQPWREDSPIVTEELIEEYKAATKLQKEQYGVVGWFNYNYLTYGCKWNCILDVERNDENGLILYCETPWCTPITFFITISRSYPDLSMNICSDSIENGCYQEFKVEKGVVTLLTNQEYVYDEDTEELNLVDVEDNTYNGIEKADYGDGFVKAIERIIRYHEGIDNLTS